MEKSLVDEDFKPIVAEPKVSALVGDIIADVQKLVRQEMALAKLELDEELEKAKIAAQAFAWASIVGSVGLILAGLAVVHIVMALGVFPWLAYTLTAAVALGSAYFLLDRFKKSAVSLDFVPRKTVANVKENVKWIRNQA